MPHRDATLSFETSEHPRKRGKRVSWKPADQLVEEREYLCEDKKGSAGPAKDFKAELEAERTMMMEAGVLGPQGPRPNSRGHLLQSAAASAQSASSAGEHPNSFMAPPMSPQNSNVPIVQIAWTIPPLLDENLWPSTKGDLSTEKDVQRRRRSMAPETPAIPDPPPPLTEPPPEDDYPQRDDSETPLLPTNGRVDPVEV